MSLYNTYLSIKSSNTCSHCLYKNVYRKCFPSLHNSAQCSTRQHKQSKQTNQFQQRANGNGIFLFNFTHSSVNNQLAKPMTKYIILSVKCTFNRILGTVFFLFFWGASGINGDVLSGNEMDVLLGRI